MSVVPPNWVPVPWFPKPWIPKPWKTHTHCQDNDSNDDSTDGDDNGGNNNNNNGDDDDDSGNGENESKVNCGDLFAQMGGIVDRLEYLERSIRSNPK